MQRNPGKGQSFSDAMRQFGNDMSKGIHDFFHPKKNNIQPIPEPHEVIKKENEVTTPSPSSP